ncbi:MAG: 4-alpha-glucanotransferase, partial [Candidatus Binataceae bacterium]
WWEGNDAEERVSFIRGLGIVDEAPPRALNDRLREQIIEAIYASPARLAILPIQDLFGWKDRINLPGTISPTNWSWRMPFAAASAMDDLERRKKLAKMRAIAERTDRFTPLITAQTAKR